MFGWFSTKCPLGTWEKTWTESRMGWLAQRLGIDRLMNAEVILPTERHFPDPYHHDVGDVQRMTERMRGYMGIAPHTIEVAVCADGAITGAAGVYYQRSDGEERSHIYVAESQLAEPMALAATLAHELAHEILLGGGILTAEVGDHEWITDLLQVYVGVGIFAANATVYERNFREGRSSWTVMGKQGYLPSRMYGYALALFAWVRGENRPAWTEHLRRDARTAFDDGMRYLAKTGDSLFRPAMDHHYRSLSGEEANGRLRSGTATVRLATLWEIERQALTTPECLAAVTERLRDDDAAVACDAARLLPRFGVAARAAVPTLLACLDDRREEVRAGAAEALGELATGDEAVGGKVAYLLRDESQAVVSACAVALTQLGVRLDESLAKDLLARLEKALIECDHASVEPLARAVLATTAKPKQAIRAFYEGKDPELRRLSLQAIEEQSSKKPCDDEGSSKQPRPVPLSERLPRRPPEGLPG